MNEIIGTLTMMDILIIFIIATLLVTHTGIAWSGILLQPGNLLDFLPSKIDKLNNPYLQNLLECPKCISGQFALWTFVGTSIYFGIFHWFFSIVVGIAWVCWNIAITTQLYKMYGYK